MNYSGDDGEKIGGGLHVFSLDEIKEVQEIDYLSEHGIPIAHLLNDRYQIIDTKRNLWSLQIFRL
ncbi:hypothetical protein [Peribacillus sp. CSMR9]|uniref:hypothetical protein n=1 Tax=Peribacillus sp. CSMR9 TaxID=2981350 RepID=UPI002952B5D8|nr:hypothetical protein [Peribacillus sp. CSMR9]